MSLFSCLFCIFLLTIIVDSSSNGVSTLLVFDMSEILLGDCMKYWIFYRQSCCNCSKFFALILYFHLMDANVGLLVYLELDPDLMVYLFRLCQLFEGFYCFHELHNAFVVFYLPLNPVVDFF